jgi:RNA polymerase sigma-70 factor (ECF subfamily)
MVAPAKLRLVLEPAAVENAAPDDDALIQALLKGDPRAGGQLYDRLIRVVEWTLLRVIGRRCEDHDDLVQSAFEQVVRTVQKQTYARNCSLTSWAAALTSNLALNQLRARRRDRRFLVEGDPAPRARAGVDVEAQVIARRRLQLARLEFARMNPQRAQAVILHDVNGLPLPELAAALGVTLAAAQSRLSRGRREISARIERFESGTNLLADEEIPQ